MTVNMNITMRTKTRLREENGFIFYNVSSVKVDYDLSGLRTRFDNLFEGVQPLGKCKFYKLELLPLAPEYANTRRKVINFPFN